MRILTDAQMRAADEATFSAGVPSSALMESAGQAVVEFLINNFPPQLDGKTIIVCGGGNNGGDGYVVARVLAQLGYAVETLALKPIGELQSDAQTMAEAWLHSGGKNTVLSPASAAHETLAGATLIVDAIFGTGFSGAARGIAAEVISAINQISANGRIPVVAIDIPSGVDTNTAQCNGAAIEAHATVAIQCLKFAHVLFPGTKNCGDVNVADIGIVVEASPKSVNLITDFEMAALIHTSLKSDPESHKGKRGRLAVVGGSLGHYGAPKMSARAGLVVGAGLVTLYVPASVTKIIAAELNELMCDSLADDDKGNFSGAHAMKEVEQVVAQRQAIVIGPGIGTGGGAKKLVSALLTECKQKKLPVVIDADALNIVADDKALLKQLGSHCVLTPHPGEMARLTGLSTAEIQANRLKIAEQFRDETSANIVLKGARTVVALADGPIWINPAASDVLATAGSGDVLAGTIGGLLARGLSPNEAVPLGVFVHGASAELVVEEKGGELGIIAGDIIAQLSNALNVTHSLYEDSPSFMRKVLPGSLHNVGSLEGNASSLPITRQRIKEH